MVKAKLIALLGGTLAVCTACGVSYSWNSIVVNGRMTGVTAASADNVAQAFGTVADGVYTSPSGRVFSSGATPEVASLMLQAQDTMSPLKQVIATASEDMVAGRPESTLSNWYADLLIRAGEKEFGRPVDVSLANFGGIRTSIVAGDILKDDIVSMFPFRNYLVYVSIKGSNLLKLYQQTARDGGQVIGGAELVIKGTRLLSAKVGGQDIDPDRIYGLVTIDFLLNGGDDISIAYMAEDLVRSDKLVIDVVLPAVMEYGEQGRPFGYHLDGRIKYTGGNE